MRVSDIPIPEVYKESSDFRFFIKWFDAALEKVRFDADEDGDIRKSLEKQRNIILSHITNNSD